MAVHRVFKPVKKTDYLETVYFYPDGHVVVVFERTKNGARSERYVKIAKSIGVMARFNTGRIIFASPAALVAASQLPGSSIEVFNNNVTTACKDIGLQVHTVQLNTRHGSFCLHELSTMTGDVTVQTDKKRWPDTEEETFEDVRNATQWGAGDKKVVAVYED